MIRLALTRSKRLHENSLLSLCLLPTIQSLPINGSWRISSGATESTDGAAVNVRRTSQLIYGDRGLVARDTPVETEPRTKTSSGGNCYEILNGPPTRSLCSERDNRERRIDEPSRC